MKKFLKTFFICLGAFLLCGLVCLTPQSIYAETNYKTYTIHYEINTPAGVENATGTVLDKTVSEVNLINIEKGNVFNVPGYNFVGWRVNSTYNLSGGEKDILVSSLVSNAGITGNEITLVAQWEKRPEANTSFDTSFLLDACKAFALTTVMFIFVMAIVRVASK